MSVDPAVFTPWFGPQKAAAYFRSLLAEDVSETQVLNTNRYLLECVHREAIAPKIFAVWLFLAHARCPSILRDALWDEASRGVRHAGMNVLKCAMKSEHWREKGWEAVGGAVGLKEVFEKLSIQEVNTLARAIGSYSRTNDPSKTRAIDELLQLLTPKVFEASSSQTRLDGSRQLLRVEDLMPLFNVASDATLIGVFSTDRSYNFIDPLVRHLLHSHMPLLREIAAGRAPVDPSLKKRLLDTHHSAMLISSEPYESKARGKQFGIPAMDFTQDIIDRACGESKNDSGISWYTRVRCIDMTLTIARRLKVPFNEILAFLERVLPTLEHPGQMLYDWKPLILKLIDFWVMATFPEAYLMSVSHVPAARQREKLHPSIPSEAHRGPLEKMLRTAFSTMPKTELTACLNALLPRTVARAKLSLLKIICKHLRGLEIDLDLPVPSKSEEQLLPWKSSLLMSFPGQDASWLFDRAAHLSPTKGLITSIRFEWPVDGGDSSSFLETIVRVHFESTEKGQTDAHDSVTHRLIEDVKLRATKARDPGDRLEWAKLTITIARYSQNVRVLRDVVHWASRFLKDPFVRPRLAKRIYQTDVASVLSCVMAPTLEDLAADVGIADAVINHLMEQALLALQEPWYKAYEDREFSSLLRRVVSSRIDAVKTLCCHGLGSENDVVETLFKGLVPTLLKYESVGMTEGYESLVWGRLSGPLTDINCPQNPRCEILKLMDSLAQQRDRLWAQQRLLRNPQTASFPEGLPRGLPLQYLFPSEEWTIAVMKCQQASSFITARVTNIVFCDASNALQKMDQEDRNSTPLVDSLKFAIRVYVGHRPVKEQGATMLEIWRHYSERIPCSGGHMESIKYYMCSLLRSKSLHRIARIIDSPQLPSLDIFDSMSRGSSSEWNPRPKNTCRLSENLPEDTLLQYRFFATKEEVSIAAFAGVLPRPKGWGAPEKPKTPDIWKTCYIPSTYYWENKEALMASALLFLDSLTLNSERVLSKGFPENADILRYPSVHLDYEFLSSVDNQSRAATAAISVLDGLVRVIPPSLLYKLSLSFLESLRGLESMAPNYALVQRCAFETMALVRRSDKPELAGVLGMKALQLFPEASSWHRMAFPPSLAKVLSRESATGILQEFTAYVFKELRKQKEPRSGKDALVKAEKPGIKITTVKMLGTMLGENKFGVPPSFAIGALKDLFDASNHIDVRVTVCTALLDILQDYDDTDQAYETFISLTPHAAGPSEKSGSGSWLQSEKAKLPRVDPQRPLLDLFTKTSYSKLPVKYRERYVNETLLPLVTESTRQHNLWMRRFLLRLDLTPEERSVTDFGPFAPDLFHTVMDSWSAYLPREFLLKYRSFALCYLDCIKLRNINDRLTAQDRSWRTTNGGDHWREYFKRGWVVTPFRLLMRLFQDRESPKVADGITREAIADEIVAYASIILQNPFSLFAGHVLVSLERFTNLVSQLGVHNSERRADVLPVVQQITAIADGLRTEDWNNDPDRSPPILPTNVQLQTLLLPFPHLHKESPSRYTTFTSSILALVEECAASDEDVLQQAMSHVAKEDARQCALGFGQGYGSSTNPRVQYLRVWLAKGLVLKWKMTQDEDDLTVREMISNWKRSSNESIRSIGWSTYPRAM
ncbi:hypothetical protein BO94DRAFT_483163 [Aspergillus sclerotioniger CBS 115572]|uniref:Uncharacterized protein n=1 Tax=Aspergillus sclerotioniger CBS 115572 TaxID=1450535 RepID=A0A317XCQ0_9EURO|nr:hypothetical protein BO94DRAFT_483163 [Aspergillus sclerotioniger CBS 115572]PWY96105.1 hypothetical protein BO94DRAFT_483163 [Aspergillus sclerotioniger CBS 115572]